LNIKELPVCLISQIGAPCRKDHCAWANSSLKPWDSGLDQKSMFRPGPMFRGMVITTQWLFTGGFSLAYLISPHFCHRCGQPQSRVFVMPDTPCFVTQQPVTDWLIVVQVCTSMFSILLCQVTGLWKKIRNTCGSRPDTYCMLNQSKTGHLPTLIFFVRNLAELYICSIFPH
jgi:hypothetical protein